MYEVPSREDIARCIIDSDVVLEKVNPTLVPRRDDSGGERPGLLDGHRRKSTQQISCQHTSPRTLKQLCGCKSITT